jgi:hypothetical protein
MEIPSRKSKSKANRAGGGAIRMTRKSDVQVRDLEVRITAIGPTLASVTSASNFVKKHIDVQKALEDSRDWDLLTIKFFDEISPEKTSNKWSDRYRATIFDYTNNRALLVYGQLSAPEQVKIAVSQIQPPPTRREFERAVNILLETGDSEIATALRKKAVYPALAIPPLIQNECGPGRVLAVRLAPIENAGVYWRVGVDLNQKTYRVLVTDKVRKRRPWPTYVD